MNLTAAKEVVLSAGVFGTPQVLLNSGIGNASELRALGVVPIHELPEVGKGLSDHTRAFALWNVNSQDPMCVYSRYSIASVDSHSLVPHRLSLPLIRVDPSTEIEEWRQNKTGSMATTLLGRLILWLRIPPNSSIWSTHPDPANGPHTPHLEVILRTVVRSAHNVNLRAPVFRNVDSLHHREGVLLEVRSPFSTLRAVCSSPLARFMSFLTDAL